MFDRQVARSFATGSPYRRAFVSHEEAMACMTTNVHEFTLELEATDRQTQIVAAGGDIALLEARQLERRVVDGICAGRTRVVLDLREITDVGPGLLGALLRIRRGVTRVDGRLALVVAGPPVSELVETTLLARLIDVADDPEQAVELVT
jgi:anti-anti-sigma factor